MLGLSNGDSGQSYTDIDFALYTYWDSTLHVYEAGAYIGYLGTYAAGDRLRVAVEGGQVKYLRNGVVVGVSSRAVTYPLLADAALYNTGASLTNVVMSGTGQSAGSAVQWLVTDHLGTPRIVVDQTGNLDKIKRHDYLPFGEELFAETGGRTTTQGYNGNDNIRQQWHTLERDVETKLDYAQARYYASTQGRFISPDPLQSSGTIYAPQTWNRYSYGLNNPLKYIDPSGLYVWDASLGGSASDDELKKQKGGGKIVDRRNEFRAALAAVSKAAGSDKISPDQQAEILRAVQSYGKEGDANGVAVASGKVKDGAAAETSVNEAVNKGAFLIDNGDGTVSANVKVTFNSKVSISGLDVAHEGSHSADRQRLASAINAGRGEGVFNDSSLNITKYATEFRAYKVSSAMAQSLGMSSLAYNNGKHEIWNSGWKGADKIMMMTNNGINKLLEEDSLYKLTPNNPGQKLLEFKNK